MSNADNSVATLDLSNLAEQINDAHRQCERTARSAVQYAITAGNLLIDAKAQCPHGTWQGWLTDNFEGSYRTAAAYMRIAHSYQSLPEEDVQRVAHLSYRDALKALAEPREVEPEPDSEVDNSQNEGASDYEELTGWPSPSEMWEQGYRCVYCGEEYDSAADARQCCADDVPTPSRARPIMEGHEVNGTPVIDVSDAEQARMKELRDEESRRTVVRVSSKMFASCVQFAAVALSNPALRARTRATYDPEESNSPFRVDRDALHRASENLRLLAEEW